MPRAKNVVARHKRRQKVLKEMKGGFGGRKNQIQQATETYYRAKRFAFRDRQKRKDMFRRLWITRINAALLSFNISYSKFMGALKKAQCMMNRKQLSEIAIHDPQVFASIVELAKKYLPAIAPATNAAKS